MSRVTHFEIPADDPQRASDFFNQVFGWHFTKWDGPIEYWLITTGPEDQPGINGGMAPLQNRETGVENIIEVPDIDQVLEKIENHGGRIIQPKMAVPGIGWMAYFNDTEGNSFGIMQTDPDAA